jgi:hypothetical protein
LPEKPGSGERVQELADGPPEILARVEQVARVSLSMSPEESRLAMLRAEGRRWKEIGVILDASPEALRKRFVRLVLRIRDALAVANP